MPIGLAQNTAMRLLAFGLATLSTSAFGAVCSASASAPVALIELYTSEGCSSCPPADAWLSALAKSGKVPSQIVPLSLHVPYWDYIGWKDRFASPASPQRHSDAQSQGRIRTIYTPQVLFNGRNLSDWHAGGLDRAIALMEKTPARAKLSLSAQQMGSTSDIKLSGTAPAGGKMFLARYENNLHSEVSRGENAGVALRHDYVVRDWIALGAVPADGQISINQKLAARSDLRAEHSGLVALVQDGKTGEVLQAVMLACNP